jgi:hypothetical protein
MAYITSANNRFLNQPVTTTATNYTVLLSDVIIEVTSTSAVRTITLPAPSLTGNIGKAFFIKDTSGGASLNNIILAPASGTIDGAVNTSIVTNYGSIQVFCDGTSYYTYGYTSGSNSLAIVERVFTSSGTYTPTVGMVYCEVQIVGGGGAGGGATAPGVTGNSSGSGGGSGEYALGVYSAATIGVSQTVTIGAGGTANSGAPGGNGGITSIGSSNLISALGGIGGLTVSNTTLSTSSSITGGLGGSGGVGGTYRIAGSPGSPGTLNYIAGVSINAVGGNGGSSYFGGGGIGPAQDQSNITGGNGLGYGSGGGGGVAAQGSSAKAGGSGAAGAVIVQEYVTQQVTTLPVVALAKGAWNRQSTSAFTPGATVLQTPFGSDPGTTPSNAGSRIDLSSLTQNEGSGITIAAQQVTITQAGTYQIIGNVSFAYVGGANFYLQCVKNTTTVLSLGVCQTANSPWAESAPVIVTAEFTVGDTIDFRTSSSQTVAGSFFTAISLAITQIPSSTIVPVTAWYAIAGTTQSLSINTGYYTQNASLTTCTLPITAATGTLIFLSGVGAGGWILSQNTGQSINFGNQVTTTGTGGSITSTNRYDGIQILCVTANTQWVVVTAVGNPTVT